MGDGSQWQLKRKAIRFHSMDFEDRALWCLLVSFELKSCIPYNILLSWVLGTLSGKTLLTKKSHGIFITKHFFFFGKISEDKMT